MKFKIGILNILALALLSNAPVIAQSPIIYGSNNGKYASVNDINIYYEDYGEGVPTLLLHGGMGSISNFKSVIPELSNHYRVIAMDSPSHGRSQAIDSLSYQILADYVVAFINTLNLNKLNIIGYSDGAIVGMLVTHKIPEKINKLVFGAGALSPLTSKPEGLDMLRTISPELLPEEFAKSYKSKSPNPEHWEAFVYSSKAMWLQEVWVPEAILPEIKNKVLVLFGDRDQFIPLSHTLKIHEALPNSELCIVPNLYHDVYGNADLIMPLLTRFLSKN